MNYIRSVPSAVALFLCLLSATSHGAELQGTVVEVVGARVKVRIAGKQVPKAGDKVQIGSEVPGVGFVALEGTWRVSSVEGEFTRAERIGTTGGKPAPGMAAVITSPMPQARQPEPTTGNAPSAPANQARPVGIDYLKLFPAKTIVAFKVHDLRSFFEGSKKTALVELTKDPNLKPLADLLIARAMKELDPQLDKIQRIQANFSGPLALGSWSMNQENPKDQRMALVAELKREAARKDFQDFLVETKLLKNPTSKSYDGLAIWKEPDDEHAITRVGRHLVLGPNTESVRFVAGNLLNPPSYSFGSKASWKKALKTSGVNTPDVAIAIDARAMLEYAFNTQPQGPESRALWRKLGIDGVKLVLITMRVAGDRYEERCTAVLDDRPSMTLDLVKLLCSVPGDAKTAFAAVPADALIAGNMHLDATEIYGLIRRHVERTSGTERAGGEKDAQERFAKFEEEFLLEMGVKWTDVCTTIKGNAVYWFELAPVLAPANIGLCLECPDDRKAQELAGHLGTFMDLIARNMSSPQTRDTNVREGNRPAGDTQGQRPKPSFQKIDFKGHTVFTESIDSPLFQAEDRRSAPYRLTWAAHGNRLVVTSSVLRMQNRLSALDARSPGLDPAKFLPAGEDASSSSGSLMVMDVNRVLNYSAKFGLPLAVSATGKDKMLQTEMARVAELAAEKPLFRNVPPLVVSCVPPKEHVVTFSMRSPAPCTLAVLLLAIAGSAQAEQSRQSPPEPK